MALLSGFAGVYTEVCDFVQLLLFAYVSCFRNNHFDSTVKGISEGCKIYSFLNNAGYNKKTPFEKHQCAEFLAVHFWNALQLSCHLCSGL